MILTLKRTYRLASGVERIEVGDMGMKDSSNSKNSSSKIKKK
jgi:hypothetical protein